MSLQMKLLAGVILSVCLLSAGCRSEEMATGTDDSATSTEGYIPVAPDYTDPEMWVTYPSDNTDSKVDVFYIVSTWEFDYTTDDGTICHYADPSLPAHRNDMKTEIDGVAEYMNDDADFYAPYYRHITLDTWATLDETLINRRYHDVSFKDISAAFNRFIELRGKERPFILAGFSQGGKSVVELMKAMPENLRDKMVAAYVMGYKVTPDDIAIAPWIKPAQGADDTGVTICYNSVSDVKYIKPIVSAPNVMCINPVNWRTDATPALLDENVTVTLNPEHNVLVLDGYDGSALPNILDILNVGDYHGIEPWAYSEHLRHNIPLRIRSYSISD